MFLLISIEQLNCVEAQKLLFSLEICGEKKESNHHHVSQQNVTFPSETCIINSQLQIHENFGGQCTMLMQKNKGSPSRMLTSRYTVCYTFSTLKQFSTVCILQCFAIAKNRFSENWLLSLLTLNISR